MLKCILMKMLFYKPSIKLNNIHDFFYKKEKKIRCFDNFSTFEHILNENSLSEQAALKRRNTCKS